MTDQNLTEIRATLATHSEQIASITATMAQMLPMLIRLVEGQARFEERLSQHPLPAEFYELRGRVEEISRRLPTLCAFNRPQPQPPPEG